MTRLLSLIPLALVAVSCGQTSSPPPEPQPEPAAATAAASGAPTPVWTVTEGVATPESVFVDASGGAIYVSQIDGAPDARDGNGRISKLDTSGTVVDASWVTGLNAPKGLRLCGSTLWAADLGEVVGIAVADGSIAARVPVPQAQFLNDVACGADGAVYVSDTVGSRIFQIRNNQASVFAEGEDLEYPNGLLVEGDRLIVGAWGKPEADFSTKVPGRLYALDLKTRAKTLITPEPFGNIDGVESDGQGGYLVSDWQKGTIVRVVGGQGRVAAQFMPGVADIGVIAGTTVVVPHMNENRVAAYDLSAVLR